MSPRFSLLPTVSCCYDMSPPFSLRRLRFTRLLILLDVTAAATFHESYF